jgi:hypothetical protein
LAQALGKNLPAAVGNGSGQIFKTSTANQVLPVVIHWHFGMRITLQHKR